MAGQHGGQQDSSELDGNKPDKPIPPEDPEDKGKGK